jgi:hypothetical protein
LLVCLVAVCIFCARVDGIQLKRSVLQAALSSELIFPMMQASIQESARGLHACSCCCLVGNMTKGACETYRDQLCIHIMDLFGRKLAGSPGQMVEESLVPTKADIFMRPSLIDQEIHARRYTKPIRCKNVNELLNCIHLGLCLGVGLS